MRFPRSLPPHSVRSRDPAASRRTPGRSRLRPPHRAAPDHPDVRRSQLPATSDARRRGELYVVRTVWQSRARRSRPHGVRPRRPVGAWHPVRAWIARHRRTVGRPDLPPPSLVRRGRGRPERVRRAARERRRRRPCHAAPQQRRGAARRDDLRADVRRGAERDTLSLARRGAGGMGTARERSRRASSGSWTSPPASSRR